jgi:hypothetical protein
MGGLVSGVAVLALLVSTVCFAETRPDTTYCNARITLRNAEDGTPVVHGSVWLRARDGRKPGRWDQHSLTEPDGVAYFSALPVGIYELSIRGISRKREDPDWQRPPGPIEEIAVGVDPYERPTQVQEFDIAKRWRIRWGEWCDSLLIRVRPTKWRLQERKILGPREPR